MKSKHIVIPVLLSIIGTMAAGISGFLYILAAMPVMFIADLFLGTNYRAGHTNANAGEGDNVWVTAIWLSIVVPLLYIPLYKFFIRKYPDKKAAWYSLGALYAIVVAYTFYISSPY